MHAHVENMEELRQRVMRLYTELVDVLNTLLPGIRKPAKDGGYMDEHLADLGFCCRDLARFFDDAKKECKAKRDLIDLVLCGRVAAQAVNDDDTRVIGQLCTASVRTGMQPILPKPGEENFYRMCAALRVPPEVIESRMLDMNWRGIGMNIEKWMGEGKNIPDGIGTRPTFGMTYRARSGVKTLADNKKEED